MKAKLLVSTAFLAASVSLSAQKSATITVHADQGKEIIPKEIYGQFVNPEKPDVPLNKNDAFQKVQKRHVQEKR